MRHLVRTQILEIETDQPSNAFGLQHNVSSMYYRFILPMLEEIFDELSPGDTIIRISRLEIDLGFMTEAEMQRSDWPLKFRDKIFRQLKEAILRSNRKSREENPISEIATQWLYYMQHGFLPWNMSNTSPAWFRDVLEVFAIDHLKITLLRKLIENNAHAVQRMVLIHDRKFLVHLLEALTALDQSALNSLIETFKSIIEEKDGRKQWAGWERTMWFEIIRYSVQPLNGVSPTDIVRRCVIPAMPFKYLKYIVESEKRVSALQPFEEDVSKEVSKKFKERDHNHATVEKNEPLSVNKGGMPADGLFIKFAGLVLLHPFLNRFFTRLACAENGKFKTRHHQNKAITLLHYLASGQIAFEEHETVMHKTLCGYPLQEPVDRIELIDDELAEADYLLQAVIAEWSVLQNTSIGALRESFLQRPGKIIESNNGDVRLIVEKNALDVLINRLPWSVALIKLPWMSRILKVEWR